MEGISVVLPAYNEAGVIYEMACESARALAAMDRPHQIILVDDGSTDGTGEEAARAAAEHGCIEVVTLPENRGKGNALKHGFYASRYPLVCFLDADLDLHPSLVAGLLSEMESSGAEVVIGSKRHPASDVDYPRVRRVYSSVYYFIIKTLFSLPVKDTQTGIKLFRREVLEGTFPRIVSKQYALDLELMVIAHMLGYRIAEVPISLQHRKEYAKITWKDARGIMVDTMAIFYRLNLLGYYQSPLKPVVEEEPRISIVIPTKEVDGVTAECVRKCHELDYSNYDIKLVTDGEAELPLEPPGSRVIASGPVGPSVKRNLGAQDSDAEIIAFIDSDAWPEYEWLRNAVPYFADEEVAAVGGPAVTPADDNRRQQASGMIYSSMFVSGSTTYRYVFRAFRGVDDYPTCNLLVRRREFEEVGGFITDFYPGEDTVLCLRLVHELGKKILYVPNVAVYHHRRPVYLRHLRQVYSYAVHRGFFTRKFPETSRRLQFFVPSIFVAALVLGLVAGLFIPLVMYCYISVMGLYALLLLVACVKSLDPLTNLMVLPGIFLTHVTYGVGFIRGILSRRMKEQ